MLVWLHSIQKTLTALVSGVLGWGAVVVASPSGRITASEWLMLGVVVANAGGVYSMPNVPATEPAVPPAEGP